MSLLMYLAGIVIGVALAVGLSTLITDGIGRYPKIRGWLLQAVLFAEKEYGDGTGRLKLSVVYDKFCERFPWMCKFVAFSTISRYVDDALEEMEELLIQNPDIAEAVFGVNN